MGSGLSRDLSWWGVVPDRDSSCGSSGIVLVGSGPSRDLSWWGVVPSGEIFFFW